MAIKKYGGYAGKILVVNLTTKKVHVKELSDGFVRTYLGGNGFAARLLYDMVDPRVDAYDPTNAIAFMTGPMQGTTMPTAGKYYIASKSPLTNGYFDSVSGGFIGFLMKYAGYDGIVVTGRADKPVYLYVHGKGEVEIKDASHLWGKLTSETQQAIKEEIGDPFAMVSAIGPAGENLVRYACVITEYRAAGRGGMGAVMGSKKLKAIAVGSDGTQEVTIADWEKYHEFLDWLKEEIKKNPATGKGLPTYGTPILVKSIGTQFGAMGTRNHQFEFDPSFNYDNISGEKLNAEYLVKHMACPLCPIGCSKVFRDTKGKWKGAQSEGPEYETLYAFGSMCYIDDLGAIIKTDALCDEYGLDTISYGVTLSFLMECYEKGLIDDSFTDGIKLNFGNDDALVNLVEKVALRQGLGDKMAEGSKRLAELIGQGSEHFAIHAKGLEIPGHSARALRGMSLGYATATRGGSHHDPRPTGEYAGVSDRTAVEGKAEWVIGTQRFTLLGDSMVICHFLERVLGYTPTEHYVKMINVVTGFDWSFEELIAFCDRVWALERCFNVKAGMRRADDTIPKRFLTEPIPEGPSKGMYTDEATLNKMLDEYYELRGYDKKLGIPKKETLQKLGLADVAEDLEKYIYA